jgi:predicted ATPase
LDAGLSRPSVAEYLSLIHQFRRESAELNQILDEETRLAREYRLPGYIASTTLLRGWAADDPKPLIPEMQQALASRLMLVSGVALPFFQALLAEVHMRVGEWGEAQSILDEAIADLDRTGMRQWESELHRLRAEVALATSQDGADVGEALFRHALRVAKQQSARSLELRAAMSLARLLVAQGHLRQASDILAPLHCWFVEGLDTADLHDASLLLRKLS